MAARKFLLKERRQSEGANQTQNRAGHSVVILRWRSESSFQRLPHTAAYCTGVEKKQYRLRNTLIQQNVDKLCSLSI